MKLKRSIVLVLTFLMFVSNINLDAAKKGSGTRKQSKFKSWWKKLKAKKKEAGIVVGTSATALGVLAAYLAWSKAQKKLQERKLEKELEDPKLDEQVEQLEKAGFFDDDDDEEEGVEEEGVEEEGVIEIPLER